MSLPEFPTITPALTRENALNQIISSIAMEELGLSHIINAEGEKLQYVLGTIPGISGPSATIDDVLKVNESVRGVLQSAAETQSILRSKLQNALSSAVMAGPTGPKGEAGAPGPGAIIPFASGSPLTLSTTTDGAPAIPGLVGFGNSYTDEATTFDANGNINLTGAPDSAINFAFAVPRDGIISGISAYFSTSDTFDLDTNVTVAVRLYESDNKTNTFTPVAGTEVTLSPVLQAGTINPGVILSFTGKLDAPVPVASGKRLLLAFKAYAGGVEEDISGYATAGLTIS